MEQAAYPSSNGRRPPPSREAAPLQRPLIHEGAGVWPAVPGYPGDGIVKLRAPGPFYGGMSAGRFSDRAGWARIAGPRRLIAWIITCGQGPSSFVRPGSARMPAPRI